MEKMVFVNVSLASGQYVEILANADGLEFDQHVEGYVRRIGPERWIAVQDKLNCCGYISTANATMNLSEYSDWATGSRCPLDLEVPIDCSGPLRVENRVQTRKISTVSILLAVVQLLTLVLVFEIVRSYRQIQSTKTKTG